MSYSPMDKERLKAISPYRGSGTKIYESTAYGDISNVSYTLPEDARLKINLFIKGNTYSANVLVNNKDFDGIYCYVASAPYPNIRQTFHLDCKKGDVITFNTYVNAGYSPEAYVSIYKFNE